jgi:hypothetical protein
VLIVAMLLSAIIGISLVSYINLCTTSLRLSDRSFYQNAAVNLAEVGVEEAMYCYNQLDNVSTATAAWTTPTAIASTLTNSGWVINSTDNSVSCALSGTAGPNVSSQVKIYCSAYNPSSSSTPVVVSKSIVTLADGTQLTKMLEVTLRKRSLFVNGLVAKNGITWVGHPNADSWNSDPDNNPATAAVAYSAAVENANCTIGASNGDIALGSSGNVYGYSRTGTSGSTSGGSVHGLGTTTNDTSRISNDFSANFPALTIPSPTTVNTVVSGSVPTDYPRSGDGINTSDGKYYYNFGAGTAISSATTIGGSIPNKDVVFLMNNHGGVNVMSFHGSSALTVTSGASLTLYTNGNFDVHGNGLVNGSTSAPAQPAKLIIYGTSTTPGGQSITVGGNGKLAAAIYAPNAAVTLQGGGSSGAVLGSIVGNSISMNGGTDFHYDEALANLCTGNPFGIVKWRELQTPDERAPYASKF